MNPKEAIKTEAAKKALTPKELLKQWLAEEELHDIFIIALPKSGGWKYGMSNSSFEFLAGAEGVIQKVKLNALDIKK